MGLDADSGTEKEDETKVNKWDDQVVVAKMRCKDEWITDHDRL